MIGHDFSNQVSFMGECGLDHSIPNLSPPLEPMFTLQLEYPRVDNRDSSSGWEIPRDFGVEPRESII